MTFPAPPHPQSDYITLDNLAAHIASILGVFNSDIELRVDDCGRCINVGGAVTLDGDKIVLTERDYEVRAHVFVRGTVTVTFDPTWDMNLTDLVSDALHEEGDPLNSAGVTHAQADEVEIEVAAEWDMTDVELTVTSDVGPPTTAMVEEAAHEFLIDAADSTIIYDVDIDEVDVIDWERLD